MFSNAFGELLEMENVLQTLTENSDSEANNDATISKSTSGRNLKFADICDQTSFADPSDPNNAAKYSYKVCS